MSTKINSKNKGNVFENKIAKKLSSQFSEFLGLENGFRRSIDSGSFFGGSNVSRTKTYNLDHAVFGDLICPKNFKFTVECKHYKTPPTFKAIVTKNVKQWDDWLSQADQDSKSANLAPLVIVKYNNCDEIVFLSESVENLEIVFTYKDKYCYRLEDILKLPSEFFFDKQKPA